MRLVFAPRPTSLAPVRTPTYFCEFGACRVLDCVCLCNRGFAPRRQTLSDYFMRESRAGTRVSHTIIR